MPSMAEELASLYELYRAGALSEKEFSMAKEACIRQRSASMPPEDQNTAAASPKTDDVAKTSSSTEATTTTTEASNRSLVEDLHLEHPDLLEGQGLYPHIPLEAFLLGAYADPGGTLRDRSLARLEQIITNILSCPQEPKFRRLRIANEVLQRELLADPPCIALLRAVGFTALDASQNAVMPLHGPPTLPPTAVFLSLPPEQHVGLVREGLAAVAFLQRCETNRRRRRTYVYSICTGVSFGIRREQAQQAIEAGDTLKYFAHAFTSDVAGDGLYSATLSIQALQRIVGLLRRPSSSTRPEGYRLLKLHEACTYGAVVQQCGALEWCVLVLGCAIHPCPADPSGFLLEFPPPEDPRWEVAEEMLANIARDVEATRTLRAAEERQEAEAAMRQNLVRAKRKEQVQTALSAQRTIDRGAEEQQRTQRPRQEVDNSRRIPVAEALSILLGKKDGN